MQHISKILENYSAPLRSLVDNWKNLEEIDLEKMTAWERSSYREVMKFTKRDK
jgi:hypothetical protein